MGVRSKKPVVFLDRDGTILNERGYLSDPKKINTYSFSFQALRNLQLNGFRLVVITNQSGIGRGFFSSRQVDKIHRELTKKCAKKKVRLVDFFYCPHLPNKNCACRKPKTKLPKRAALKLNLDLKKSYVVGDQWRDIQMGVDLRSKPVLVLTGAGRESLKKVSKKAAKVSKNLLHASRWIIKDFNSKNGKT